MMTIQTDNGEEKTVNIEGEDFWTVLSFSRLTKRTNRSIRKTALDGNRIRKLKSKFFNGRVYIEEKELFDFPFTTMGRPGKIGNSIEKFYLEDGRLMKEETIDKQCQI